MSNLNNKRQQYCCSCSVSCDAAIMPPVPRMRTTASAVRQISSEHAPIFRHWVGHAQNGYPISEPVIRRALRGISIEWMPTEKVMSRGFWTRVQFPPVPPKRKASFRGAFLFVGTGANIEAVAYTRFEHTALRISSLFALKRRARCGCTYRSAVYCVGASNL